LHIGGGNSTLNTFKDIIFWTSADGVTTTGTEAMRIDSSQDATFAGEIIFSSTTGNQIHLNTSDGTDNGIMQISAAGATGVTRGPYISMEGNEVTTTGGRMQLVAGDGNNGTLSLHTGSSAAARLQIEESGATNFSGGLFGINETANANMTIGLTINQGANDNQIVAFKSSDVSHPITSTAETDTFGAIFKGTNGTTEGGLRILALGDTGTATNVMLLDAWSGASALDTGKATTATGAFNVRSAISNGATGSQIPGADENLVTFQAYTTTRFIFDQEGSGHADVEWTTYSDARLKSNIRDLPYGLDTAMALKPRIFDRQSGYISDGEDQCHNVTNDKNWSVKHKDGELVLEDKKRVQIGLIAQEAELLIPELVKTPPNEYSFYSMDYERLSVVNLSAIQELNEKVVALEAQMAALQN